MAKHSAKIFSSTSAYIHRNMFCHHSPQALVVLTRPKLSQKGTNVSLSVTPCCVEYRLLHFTSSKHIWQQSPFTATLIIQHSVPVGTYCQTQTLHILFYNQTEIMF